MLLELHVHVCVGDPGCFEEVDAFAVGDGGEVGEGVCGCDCDCGGGEL